MWFSGKKKEEPEEEIEEEEDLPTVVDYEITFIDGEVMKVTAAERDGTDTSTRFSDETDDTFLEVMDVNVKHIRMSREYILGRNQECGAWEVKTKSKKSFTPKRNRIQEVE